MRGGGAGEPGERAAVTDEGARPTFRTPYSDYDVLDKWDSPSWNEQTREVVRHRLESVPARAFLTPDEYRTLEAVCHRLVPQPDRPDNPVPIAPWIDRKLQENRGDGYRYEDMPPMREAWRLGLRGIETESRRRHGAAFPSLSVRAQDDVLRAIQRGDVRGDPWDRLSPARFFTSLLLTGVVAEYYAHPAGWSECGFGGPASPRGYVRLGPDQHDRWEAEEREDSAPVTHPERNDA